MKSRAWFSIVGLSVALTTGLFAAQENAARMTYVSKEVRFHGRQNVLRQASLGDIVSAGVAIHNGAKARSELIFGNRTVARLGANTILNLTDGSAGMNLHEGALLFQIPKGSSTEITSGPVAITSKGATGILERYRDFYIKVMLLEGEVRVFIPGQIGESILMEPGQILITSPKATALPEAADFDIARVARTCRLISDFSPLASQELIALEARKQMRLTSKGNYIPSNLVIFGRGTLVSLVPPQPKETGAQKVRSNSKPTQ